MTDPYVEWIREGTKKGTGKSQRQLSLHLGLSAATINKVLLGRRRLFAAEISKAAEYLGIPPPGTNATIAASPVNKEQLSRIERKLDILMAHLGINLGDKQ